MKIPFDFSEFKTLFSKHPDRLGVEIDKRAVWIVRTQKGEDGKPAVAAFGGLDINLWHAGVMEQQRFRSAIRQIGMGLTKAAVNIEHPSLRIRRMVFAKMPESDILEAIRWNFREQVEGAIEKYVVGWTLLKEDAGQNRVPVMAFGVSGDAMKEYSALAKSMGLKLKSLEPSSTALLAIFHANGILDDGKYHVCVNFGDTISQFIVLGGASLMFSRPLAGVSGDALLYLLMKNLNIGESEARNGLDSWVAKGEANEEMTDGSEDPVKVQNFSRQIGITMGHFLSQLVIEVQRSIDAFCVMYGIDRVDKIHISGLGAAWPEIAAHMTKSLGIETVIFNPFERLLDPARQTNEVRKAAPFYSVAAGLALP